MDVELANELRRLSLARAAALELQLRAEKQFAAFLRRRYLTCDAAPEDDVPTEPNIRVAR